MGRKMNHFRVSSRPLIPLRRAIVSWPLALWISLSSAFALEPAVQGLVTYETKANGVSLRSDQMVQIENYEIPARLLKKDFSARLAPNIRDALVFEKNGEEYVRWMINPEDTKWHKELEKYLKENGIEPTRHKFFQGYQTASRSYIVEDPKTKTQFSLKVSTNKTGGNWTDKKQEAADAFDARRSMDYVMKEGEKRPYQHFKVMDEPAAFGIEKIDQGMLVRELNDLPDGKRHYLPGFSAVHGKTGRELALLNGSTDPAAFWNEHYNKPLARSLAELAAKTGVAFDSPHSQNFLIELDDKFRPTGKIVLRDLGDIYLTPEIVRANGGDALVKSWPRENVTTGRVNAYVGTLHGNEFPDWMDNAVYEKWGKDFYVEYDKEFAKQAGLPKRILPESHFLSGRYFGKQIEVTGPEWERYLSDLEKGALAARPKLSPPTNCANVFSSL